MRHGIQFFTVCILSFLLSGCILSYSPVATNVNLNPIDTQRFSVQVLLGQAMWYVDDNLVDPSGAVQMGSYYDYEPTEDDLNNIASEPSHTIEVRVFLGAMKISGQKWNLTIIDCSTKGVLAGSYTIYTQADVDFLSEYYTMSGDLIFENTSLTNISGIECLESVGGDLIIRNNPSLTTLEGLRNLQSIGGSLVLDRNSKIADLSPLNKITEVNDLIINNCTKLMNLGGLSKLTMVRGDIQISNNLMLMDISGLTRINTQIHGSLIIDHNTALTGLAGLGHITSIEDSLIVTDNFGLMSLSGLSGLQTIGNDLEISGNSFLTQIRMYNIESVGGNVYIYKNSSTIPLLSSSLPQSEITFLLEQTAASITMVDAVGFCQLTVNARQDLGPLGNFTIQIRDYGVVSDDSCIGQWDDASRTIILEIHNGWTRALTIGDVLRNNFPDLITSVSEGSTYPWTLAVPQPNEFHLTGGSNELIVGGQVILVDPEDNIPLVRLDTPAADLNIAPGGSVDFQVTLEGGDPPLSYLWSFDGAEALTENSGVDVYAEDPGVVVFSQPGIYNVTLTVEDMNGDVSIAPFTVLANNLPVAVLAGFPDPVVLGAITLDGSGSDDDDSQTLEYHWAVLSRPVHSAATLPVAPTATDTIEFMPDLSGSYQIQLVVSDGYEESAPVSITIAVIESPVNSAPVADAGGDQTVPNTTAIVTLDGSGSSDINGDTLTYSWTLSVPTGSTAALSDPTSPNPTFVPDIEEGVYMAQLIVFDGTVNSLPDTVTITVTIP